MITEPLLLFRTMMLSSSRHAEGMTLASIPLMLMAVAFISLITLRTIPFHRQQHDELRRAQFLQELGGAAEYALHRHAQLPLTELLIVHEPDRIAYRDEELHIASLRTDALGQMPGSNAVTFLRLASHCVFSVQLARKNNWRVCTPSCSSYDAPKSYIAVSKRGIAEILSAANIRESCATLETEVLSGFFAPRQDMESAALLFPVKETITLYLARDGCLRFMQTVGKQTLENQPLACDDHISSLVFDIDPGLRFFSYTAQFENSGGVIHRAVPIPIPAITTTQLIFSLYTSSSLHTLE